MGFTNPPISKALAFYHGEQLVVTLGISDLERGATVVAEIELGKVAVQMRFAAMLIDADHAALEDGEHVLNRVGMNDHPAFTTGIASIHLLSEILERSNTVPTVTVNCSRHSMQL